MVGMRPVCRGGQIAIANQTSESSVAKRRIDQVDVRGQRVLVRVDFNVPLEAGSIADDRRIRMALPTITSILERHGRVVLMSHLGRPEGAGYEPELSLESCAHRLGELMGGSCRGAVRFPSHDCTDGAAHAAVNMLADGEALLLENLRFHKEEKKGDDSFASKLAALGDIYCNDAFGTCHRADASMVAVPRAMGRKPKVCGFLVEKEIRFLHEAIDQPASPFVVVLGGAKVSDKLPAIEHLLPKADHILIGGAMAYTFLAARGEAVGASRVEDDRIGDARRILDQVDSSDCNLHLPSDHVISERFESGAPTRIVAGPIPDGTMGLDIGPESARGFAEVLREARTIVWNGPMGVFEWKGCDEGTRIIAEAMTRATSQSGAVSIVGGGDSAAAAEYFGLAQGFSHVSTGGGASLAMLSGESFESVGLLDDAEPVLAGGPGA